ncbi:MAG: hypothetical protein L0G23_10880 [Ruaniaceae bacterium]|nr:hypothetical protein [Ruaniaceae bacterium]
MSTPITILYYVLLLIHVVSFLGAFAIALKVLTKGGAAKGLWHSAVSALVAGVALTGLLSWQGEVNTTKIGIKLAVAIAVVALSLLVARREKEAALFAAGAPKAPAIPADPREADDAPQAPVDTIRPLLIAVVIGVIVNTLLALLW